MKIPYSNIYQVKSPIKRKQLESIDNQCQIIQFSTPLSDADYRNLSNFLQNRQEITLRIFGPSTENNLEFLKHFTSIKRFSVDVWDIQSLDGINALPSDLQYLGIGKTRSKVHSLRFLERFNNLKELWIEGHTKHIDSIGVLKSLQKLTLRSVTLPDLSILRPLNSLWWFALKLGGTKDITLLSEVGELKYLEIWRVRGLSDISSISNINSLQFLFLQTLNKVEHLPSFKKLINLKRIHLETMKGIKDISPLADAPAIEDLIIGDMPQLHPNDFKQLIGHPSLKHAGIFLGNTKKNEAIKHMLPFDERGYSKFDFNFR